MAVCQGSVYKACFLCSVSLLAHHYSPREFNTVKMSTPTYAITGIQEGFGPAPGQIPLRYDVDDWYPDEKYAIQHTLFFLALTKYQAMDTKEKLSYFQVAG